MKTYGIKVELSPANLLKTYTEQWTANGIDFLVRDSCIEVSYDNHNQEEEAKKTVDRYIQVWSLYNDIRLSAKYVYWELKDGKKYIKMNMPEEDIKVSDSLTIIISRKGDDDIEIFDTRSFAMHEVLVKKSFSNEILGESIGYYTNEVLEDKHPLYGVYKAIEVIADDIGLEKLANIAGVSKKYITDVRQTTQTDRHAKTEARIVLTDMECRHRAKRLIIAYADSLK